MKRWVLKTELLSLRTCQILLMHLFYVPSGKMVKKEVASFKREAALSVSENSPYTELGNKNTLASKCMFETCSGMFSSSHTNSMGNVLKI